MRSNIRNVIKFETARNLKKPTFWIAALLAPLILVGYTAFIGFTSYDTGSSLKQGSDTSGMSLGVYDAAQYLTSTEIVNAKNETQKLEIYNSNEDGVAAVKSGKLDVFYYIPPDFNTTFAVQAYAKPDSASVFNNYNAPIQALLTNSATTHVAPVDFAILTNAVSINTTNFSAETDKEINPAETMSKMIVPLAGLAFFYVLIVIFGNRLTTAMVEEKENRISEIILTAMKPGDLIIGKIVALIALGFVQLAALIIPGALILTFGSNLDLIPAGITISWDPMIILSTLLLLVFSYFLFAGLCITIGTLVPTAKDAGSFAGVIMIMVILPLFFLGSFMSDTPDLAVYILSYFPPSAPIALMARNAFGTLPIWELVVGLIELAVCSIIIVRLAVQVFRRTAIEFTSKINLRTLFAGGRK